MKSKLLLAVVTICIIGLFVENMELSSTNSQLETTNEQQIEYIDTMNQELEKIPKLEEEVKTLTEKNLETEKEKSVIEEKNVELETENSTLKSENSSLKEENNSFKEEIEVLKTTQAPKYRNGSFKSYTDYNCLSKTSKQWELQELAYTDEYGLRKIDDYYLAALGSYYSRTIGAKFLVTLASGNTFKVMLCDQKSDKHTDSEHKYSRSNGCMVEFYVDTAVMPEHIKSSGNIGTIPFFSGEIISIEKIN